MFAFVVLDLFSSVLAKIFARRNVSEMSYFVSSGAWNINSEWKTCCVRRGLNKAKFHYAIQLANQLAS